MHKLLLTALCLVLSLTLISSYALAGTIEEEVVNGMKTIEPYMGDDVLAINVRNIVDRSSGSPQFSWLPMVEGVLYGPAKDGDAIILEIHKDGKPVRSFRVDLKPLDIWIDGMGSAYYQNWKIDPYDKEDKALTSAGDFTFVFKYVDFATEQERVLMERKITILKAGTCDVSTGKHAWKFAVSSDNLLGGNYVFMSPGYGEDSGEIAFYTWTNREDSYLKNIKFKITVDGNPVTVPGNFAGNPKNIRSVEQVEEMYDYANSQRIVNKYNFYLMKFFTRLYWGPKNDNRSDGWVALIDHPGKWVVKVYLEGQMFREWRFTVNSQGMIEKHPEQDQSNPGALKFDPFKVFVNTYYPNPEDFDEQFDPAAIKAGSFYSRPG